MGGYELVRSDDAAAVTPDLEFGGGPARGSTVSQASPSPAIRQRLVSLDVFRGITVLRNYRYFFLFIATSTFLCIFILIFSWLNVYGERVDSGGSIWKALRKEVYSFVLIIYTFVVEWFVGGLTVVC